MTTNNAPQPRTGAGTHQRSRRGTIVILAVGILAVLAVASLSYMTVVRLDRTSSAAYATDVNFRQQVGAAAGHIRSLIGADVFGNKVVNASVKERIGATQQLWPRAFEDGEYWDYPSIDIDWLNQPSDPDRIPGIVNGNPAAQDYSWRIDFDFPTNRFPPARPDDAWLASQTPVDTDGDGRWDTWPQITNLRSAWLYRSSPSGPNTPGWWQRDHGRFVDIAEWLANSQSDPFAQTLGRGDPGLSIDRFDNSHYGAPFGEDNESDLGSSTPGMGGGPNLGIDRDHNNLMTVGAQVGSDLSVWEFQMSRMQEFLDGSTNNVDEDFGSAASTIENVDDRMWADTDGDGRADARWQEIDALGELFGYRWLIAARIIDNSAMINVNSSLEWQIPGNTTDVGMGRTPGDVDLYRLLRRSNSNAIDSVTGLSIGHPDLIVNTDLNASTLENIWNYHREEGWNLSTAFQEINDEYSTSFAGFWTDLTHDASMPLDPTDALDAREREMFWRTAGAAPQRRSTLAAIPVPIGDEIDLRARFGSNYVPFTSKIEDRLEQVQTGGNPQGWLPGMPIPGGSMEDYPSELSLGPMRSKEDGRELRTFGRNALTPENDFIGNYNQTDKIDRIMGDIRRHMTTINGSANFSPIPVLNSTAGSVFERRYVNTKIRLDDPDLIREPVADAAMLDGNAGIKAEIAAFVNEAFGAFLWALAPMVTDQPLAPGLALGDMNDANSARGYGAGATGPAMKIDPNMQQAYSVLRSASLAINLADALDRDLNMQESPTVGRFSPMGAIDNVASREFVMDKAFSHGEIQSGTLNGIATSDQHFGLGSNGVTLVGLDRQPFLMEAVHVALYQDFQSRAFPGVIYEDVDLDPADPADHVGSLFLVEIGNPWPDQIDVSDYFVRLSEGATEFKMPLKPSSGTDPFNDAPGTSIIDPGSSLVFWMMFPFDNLEEDFTTDFQSFFIPTFFDQLTAISSMTRGVEMTYVAPDDPDTVLPNEDPAPLGSAFGSSSVPVQLWYDDPTDGDLAYLVDRMSDAVGTGSFPNMSGKPQIPAFPQGPPGALEPPTGSGRAAVMVSMSRPKGNIGAGYPGYVIERGNNSPDIDDEGQSWRFAPSSLAFPPENKDTYPAMDLPVLILDSQTLNIGTGAHQYQPPFQLFVPNGPLRSVAELHMLNSFTHMYVNMTPGYDISQSMMNAGLAPHPSNPLINSGPGFWKTISEQLGADAHYFYDSMASASMPNPYLGVLDPTRYILGSGELEANPMVSAEWPDFMRIPLALRVFDCFTVTPGVEPLVQGKINLNTAPIEVLESMPFFAPQSEVEPGLPGGDNLQASPSMSRAELVRDYRDLRPGSASFDGSAQGTRIMATDLAGLRLTPAAATRPDAKGLVNLGELLAMADWSSGDGNPGGDGMPNTGIAGYDDFMQLGVDGASNDGAPLSLRYATSVYGGGTVSTDFNEFVPYESRNDYADGTYDPEDDPEERLALARSALDIASTRSDVFTAYFVLRAYNPEQIEIIQTQGIGDLDLQAQLLDEQGAPNPSPGLDPVHESRWMGVFDRSGMTRPNQRPRVLLLVELPID